MHGDFNLGKCNLIELLKSVVQLQFTERELGSHHHHYKIILIKVVKDNCNNIIFYSLNLSLVMWI